MHNIFGASFVC